MALISTNKLVVNDVIIIVIVIIIIIIIIIINFYDAHIHKLSVVLAEFRKNENI